ncbi:MAG: hypothetical protein WD206_09990 [Actinomycetota bacterium]
MGLFEPIFAALDEAGVRYVVVGGVAVVLHGHARLTADLDIAIDLAPQAARDAIDGLQRLGLRPRVPVDASDFADPEVRARWIADRDMRVLSLWDPANPMRSLNLFVENPIDFEELWIGSEVVDLDDMQIRVASKQPSDGWEADRLARLTNGLEATPAQRLAWLEEAIEFAHRAGALPRGRPDRSPPGGPRDEARR